MNNAVTIRIFIKGLRSACHLAARIYEKDPHTLIDTVTEVEELNAVTTYGNNHFIFNGQHGVKQGRQMLPM